MNRCGISREDRIKNGRKRRKFMNRRHWKQANDIRQEIKRIESKLRTGEGLNLRESQRKTSMNQLKRLLGIEKKRMNLDDLKKVLQYKREEVTLRTTNCAYGLNLIKPHKREKQLVSPPRRVVVNRSPEEWNALIQQAKI
jgi:hypothetical protein